MGQNLCCMRQPSSSENEPKEGTTHGSNFSAPASSFSSMETDMEKRHYLIPPASTNSTPEECLINRILVVVINLKLCKCCTKNFTLLLMSKRISLLPEESVSPRADKFGLLGKTEEEDDEGSCGGSISPRSHSSAGKLKKRVRFKLPQAADIILFYSPKETFEEY